MTVRSVVLSILSAAVSASCALPPESPLPVSPVSVGPGQQRSASNLYVLIDASGTMWVNKTFPKAKALSETLVAALPEASGPSASSQYNVAFIGFGGDERVRTDLEGFDRGATQRALAQLELLGSSDGLGGKTPLAAVIREVARELEGRGGDTAIFLFSDGIADDPAASLRAALALAESGRGETCIHSVQMGEDTGGAAFLGRLADTTLCGSMRKASSIDDAASFEKFVQVAVLGAAELPPVAAAPVSAVGCGTIRLRGIEFGFNDAAIDEAGEAVLDAAVELLGECSEVDVKVEGHTCSIGPAEYNQGLSERRAVAVKQYLSGQGVERGRLSAVGHGENEPIASNDTREGRARNRRVDLNPL